MRLDYSADGIDMPPEDLRRISDPLVTTKRGSGGSGRGMHIIYNIAKAARGG